MLPTNLRRSVTLNHPVNEGRLAIVRLKHESPSSGRAPRVQRGGRGVPPDDQAQRRTACGASAAAPGWAARRLTTD